MSNKHLLSCIGHITLDKVVTPKSTVYMPGGTAFYFANAIHKLPKIDFSLVTAMANSELEVVEKLKKMDLDVTVFTTPESHYFENIYGENQDNRTQRVLGKSDPFSIEQLKDIEAEIFHLGSLMADDFSLEVLKYVASKGLVSVDSQGYLRKVQDQSVYAIDWENKLEALKYIHYLKANEHEMKVLTGFSDIRKAAKQLYEWGVKEVLITLGSYGSVIYDGEIFNVIPAYRPKNIVDATGCGDTYMTGYLYKRALKYSIEESGRFAAAISSLKIEDYGPLKATMYDIEDCLNNSEQYLIDLDTFKLKID